MKNKNKYSPIILSLYIYNMWLENFVCVACLNDKNEIFQNNIMERDCKCKFNHFDNKIIFISTISFKTIHNKYQN